MPIAPARSPLLTVEAILLIVLGIIALVLPLFAGLFAATAVGVLLILSGGVGLASALRGGKHWHRGWSIASAVIALIVGLLIVFNPLVGAISLTLLLGAYLLLDGVSLIGLALDQRKRGTARWGLLALSGGLDLVLALLALMLGAVGSAVVVGIIVGIDLIAAGAALLLIHRSPLTVPGPLGRPI
jgi:uncharacterized membrane protein HdeD (DUF308 family)